jgi:hypothetical protein
VIQKLLELAPRPTYLEIGVAQAETFLPLRAHLKFAVDPVFGFRASWDRGFQLVTRWFRPASRHYFWMTSDVFFQRHAGFLRKHPIDVAFIDGSHSYTQSLADVANCLKYLAPGGTIVMHDCSPSSEAMAWPAGSYREVSRIRPPGFDGPWCGDVWKTIVHLRRFSEDLDVLVIDADYGLGILRPRGLGARVSVVQAVPEVAAMTYAQLDRERVTLLNLLAPDTFAPILESFRSGSRRS